MTLDFGIHGCAVAIGKRRARMSWPLHNSSSYFLYPNQLVMRIINSMKINASGRKKFFLGMILCLRKLWAFHLLLAFFPHSLSLKFLSHFLLLSPPLLSFFLCLPPVCVCFFSLKKYFLPFNNKALSGKKKLDG